MNVDIWVDFKEYNDVSLRVGTERKKYERKMIVIELKSIFY